jgi:hypothetical protein
MEHRRGLRHDTDVAVRFVALPATIGTGRVTNISLTGAFMETTCKLPLKCVIYIEGLETLKERGKPPTRNRLAATVVRRCSAGVGLEWCTQWSQSIFESRIDTGASAALPDEGAGPCIYRLEFID